MKSFLGEGYVQSIALRRTLEADGTIAINSRTSFASGMQADLNTDLANEAVFKPENFNI